MCKIYRRRLRILKFLVLLFLYFYLFFDLLSLHFIYIFFLCLSLHTQTSAFDQSMNESAILSLINVNRKN